MIATHSFIDTVQSEPHSHTEYVKFEPSQHTVMEYTRRFSYRQSRLYKEVGYINFKEEYVL